MLSAANDVFLRVVWMQRFGIVVVIDNLDTSIDGMVFSGFDSDWFGCNLQKNF
jgi:hypothetical protein